MIHLQKQQSKSEQHKRRNNVQRFGIFNKVSCQNLEEIVIGIHKDSRIDVNPLDIKGSHTPSLGMNATNTTQRVIVKFVNRKHSEAMLQRKKDINQKSKVLVSHSLCPSIINIGFCGESAKNCREKVFFCLGAVVTLRITENNPTDKILHEK